MRRSRAGAASVEYLAGSLLILGLLLAADVPGELRQALAALRDAAVRAIGAQLP